MIKKNQVENICKKLNTKLIAYKFLAKGNHNINYVLETDKEKFVLRIENNKQFKNLKKEYKLLKSLSLGLAPKVFLFDSSRKIIEMDYFVHYRNFYIMNQKTILIEIVQQFLHDAPYVIIILKDIVAGTRSS